MLLSDPYYTHLQQWGYGISHGKCCWRIGLLRKAPPTVSLTLVGGRAENGCYKMLLQAASQLSRSTAKDWSSPWNHRHYTWYAYGRIVIGDSQVCLLTQSYLRSRWGVAQSLPGGWLSVPEGSSFTLLCANKNTTRNSPLTAGGIAVAAVRASVVLRRHNNRPPRKADESKSTEVFAWLRDTKLPVHLQQQSDKSSRM